MIFVRSQHKPPTDDAYRKAYDRGWNTSRTYDGRGSALDNADGRNEPDAWYSGYFDYGAGREKWHTYYCSRTPGGIDGCTEHEGGAL